jgi:signal transduction histidine kinase
VTVGALSPPTASPGSRLGGVVSDRTLTIINASVLAACLAGAALSSTREQWDNLGLLAVLGAFTTVAELGAVQFPGQMQAALSSLGLAVAMTFLGPAPAVAIAVPPVTIDSARRRVAGALVVGNAATYALFTVVGSLGIGAALGGHPPDVGPATLLVAVALLVVMTDLISFVSVMTLRAVHDHVSVRRAMRVAILPVVPHMLVSAASTGAAAVVYVTAGLGALAFLLAVSLVSGRLVRFTALAQAREQQVAELALARARLLGEALTAEERERVRLAGEIHDDALQHLAIARLELRSPEGVRRARRSLEAADAALRTTLARIVPAAEMRTGGLATALETIAADLCSGAGMAWDVSVDPAVDGAERTLVCSLARELMTNAVKHARASRLAVSVEPLGDGLRLEVRDDGRGFDPALGAAAGHVGLTLVENRARAANGRLALRSAPGEGTCAVVELAQ